jgi:hypothetical protein
MKNTILTILGCALFGVAFTLGGGMALTFLTHNSPNDHVGRAFSVCNEMLGQGMNSVDCWAGDIHMTVQRGAMFPTTTLGPGETIAVPVDIDGHLNDRGECIPYGAACHRWSDQTGETVTVGHTRCNVLTENQKTRYCVTVAENSVSTSEIGPLGTADNAQTTDKWQRWCGMEGVSEWDCPRLQRAEEQRRKRMEQGTEDNYGLSAKDAPERTERTPDASRSYIGDDKLNYDPDRNQQGQFIQSETYRDPQVIRPKPQPPEMAPDLGMLWKPPVEPHRRDESLTGASPYAGYGVGASSPQTGDGR